MNTNPHNLLLLLTGHGLDKETLEVLADPELMEALRQSIKEVAEEQLIPWEKAKAELGP